MSYKPGGGGGGDMYKSTYDSNNDGKVNEADSVAWAGIPDKPSTLATIRIRGLESLQSR